MLAARHISKSFPTPRGPVRVLDDLSLTVAPGEAVAIVGPSGCGKSTLLYILGGLEPPSGGTVEINGTDPYGLGQRDQAAFRGGSIGFVFQDHLLLPQLSALDNVLAPTLAAAERADRAAAEERARELLTRVGLGDRLTHRPAELSGGERQRVAIARALVRQPALLLCDEPTGNLDRSAAHAVADVLFDLHASRTTMLVIVTHSAELAARCQRRYELDGGTLVPRG